MRELENLIERACILEESDVITPSSIPQEMLSHAQRLSDNPTDISIALGKARQNVVDKFEKEYLTELLIATHGRIKDASQWAGVTPRQLHKLISRHGLHRKDFRSQSQKMNS